jgi:CheY-like chemotaxis protein
MKKILIVEDQASIRRLLRLALRDSFSLDEASEADSAYQRILADRPDAVVLDVMMPGSMNGYQLCEMIKRDPALADIHIVLTTARGQVADQEFGLSLGANAYFVKPFSPLALAHHLRGALFDAPETMSAAGKTVAAHQETENGAPLLGEFEAAWAHSPWAMVAIGRDGNVSAANPAFERHTGMTGSAVFGMGEAGLSALFSSLSLENSRVETSGSNLRAIHYLKEAPAGRNNELQLSQVAELLREPLASIFGFAELLLTQNYAEDVRHDLTETLLNQVEAMSNILNERLNLTHKPTPEVR